MTAPEVTVIVWSLTVGAGDLYAKRIPNVLTLGACLVALLWLFITGHSILGAPWQSVIFASLASQLFSLPAYAIHLLGAGDVKLLLAIALIGGKDFTLFSFVIAAVIASISSLVQIIMARVGKRPVKMGRWFPFGAALSIGMLCAIGIMK